MTDSGERTPAGFFQAILDRISALETRRGPVILSGEGSPEGVVAALQGALYVRLDGGAGERLYSKVSDGGGDTGWLPV